MPEKTLYWQQPQSQLINSWEFQFQRAGSNEWEWVLRVEPVDDCLECFQAIVEIPQSALLIRSRAVGDDGYSVWSNHLPVHLPEPSSINIALLFFVLLSTCFRRKRFGD